GRGARICCCHTCRIDEEAPPLIPTQGGPHKMAAQTDAGSADLRKTCISTLAAPGHVHYGALLKSGRAARQVGDGADRAPLRTPFTASTRECSAPVLQRDSVAGEQF